MKKKQEYKSTIKRKVILAFLLAAASLVIYYAVTKLAFEEMVDTIEVISEPNEKLEILNSIFQDIIRIDQAQKNLLVKNPNEKRSVLFSSSISLNNSLDRYRQYIFDDEVQMARLDSLVILLEEKDKMHISYLKTRKDFLSNKNLSMKIDSLADVIARTSVDARSDIVTTHKKTTRTFVQPKDTIKISTPKEEKKQGFLQRLFSKKSEQSELIYEEFVLTDEIIEEELEVFIDSLHKTISDTVAIQGVENKILALKNEQLKKNRYLVAQELHYVNTTHELINYVIKLMHDIEQEELMKVQENSYTAIQLSHKSLTISRLILIFFLLAGSVLVYLILADVTRSRLYRLQLLEAKLETERLSKVKERFLTNVSHEIKTPLQTIIGFSEQLAEVEPENKVKLDLIKDASSQLNYLVYEILDYSKIVSDKFSLQPDIFMLKDIINHIRALYQFTVENKGLDLIFELPDDLEGICIYADGFRIKQILSNLMNNAVKYTHSGQIQLTVTAQKEEKEWVYLEFRLKDTGIGINPEEVDRIFKYFERGSNRDGLYEGTGLGLSIVNELVKSMGGQILVESTPGTGSEFVVKLRVPDGHTMQKLPRQRSHQDKIGFGENVLPQIYVIDDDPSILTYMQEALNSLQLRAYLFSDPDKLMAQIPLNEPFILITDIRMKSMSGIELCKMVKEKAGDLANIIAMTAQFIGKEDESWLEAGFKGVLEKPFTQKDIVKILSGLDLTIVDGDNNIIEEPTGKGIAVADIETADFFQASNQSDFEEITRLLNEGKNERIAEVLHQLSSRLGFENQGELYISLRSLELRFRKDAYNQELVAELKSILGSVKSTQINLT